MTSTAFDGAVVREFLETHSMPEPNSGCWLWLRSVTDQGYGKTAIVPGDTLAHRVSWRAFRNPIPEGKLVLHNCDNTYCINPDHLRIGTVADNVADRVARGRTVTTYGEKPGSKLTVEKVRAIRADPRTLKRVAADYGVHFSLISRIRRGKAWPHIT